MKTQERLAFITEIAKRDTHNLGKTGMMKFLYLLQTIYKVPLGYEFEIYTYGPYCQTVMSDIEYAEFADCIQVKPITYPSGLSGYSINAKQTDNKVLDNTTDIIHEYSRQIDEVIASFSEKSAKELELYSTIVFVTSSFYQNSWGKEKGEICKTVKGIKPHFSNDTICEAYDDLDTHKFLDAIEIK